MTKKARFYPLLSCGCPVIGDNRSTRKAFGKCTCVVVSPKTGGRGRRLAPAGKYIVDITSSPTPGRLADKPFKKGKKTEVL